jgi:hypothetical protein
MTDTPETQPVEGAEILKLLRKIDAQTRTNGEALSKLAATLTAADEASAALATMLDSRAAKRFDVHGKALAEVSEHLGAIGKVVAEAAPLLQSGPARALAGGRKVADYLKGGRRG